MQARRRRSENRLQHVLVGPAIGVAHRSAFEALKATGYDGVEIPVIAGHLEDYRALATMLDDIGLERTTLTVLPHGANPLSESTADRQKGVDHLRWALDCSATLGSKLLVGPIHQTLGEFTGRPPSATEFERALAFHCAAGDYAAERGLRIAIEAMNRFEAHLLNTMAPVPDSRATSPAGCGNAIWRAAANGGDGAAQAAAHRRTVARPRANHHQAGV